MARTPSRTEGNRDPRVAPRPTWRLLEGAAESAPPSRRARWLLVAAIILQVAWMAVLAAMAIFARWK